MIYLQKNTDDKLTLLGTYERKQKYPDISFPNGPEDATDEFLKSLDLYVGEYTKSPTTSYIDSIPAIVLSETWELVEGRKYKQAWTVVVAEGGLTEEEAVRSVRNERLVRSDWSQATDHPTQLSDEDKNLWSIHRQALRDVPDQDGFPHEVEWPEEP